MTANATDKNIFYKYLLRAPVWFVRNFEVQRLKHLISVHQRYVIFCKLGKRPNRKNTFFKSTDRSDASLMLVVLMIHLLSDFPQIGQNEKFDICSILNKISVNINSYCAFTFLEKLQLIFERLAISTCDSKQVIFKKVACRTGGLAGQKAKRDIRARNAFSSRASRVWSRSALVYRVSLSAPLIHLLQFCVYF